MEAESGVVVDANLEQSDKSFRTVSNDVYEFGFNEDANDKTRIIVKEQDPNFVREYDFEEGTNYFCIGCFKNTFNKKFAYFDENHSLVVPTQHECDPIPLSQSEFDQEMKQTMFLQAQSQPCSPMALYTSSAVNTSSVFGNSKASTLSSEPDDEIPIALQRPCQPPPEVIPEGSQAMNKFSAALLDQSTSSSPEYVPESTPFNSASSTPIHIPAYQRQLSNTATSSLAADASVPGNQSSHRSDSNDQQTSTANDSQTYNTAETPSDVLCVFKSDKERRCAETPDSVHGHYLYNGFIDTKKSAKNDRGEMDDTSSTNLNNTLSVDVSFTTPSNEDNVPVPKERYQYGYSWRTGSANKRIIVFEPNDRTKVRQYASNGSYFWFCIDCFRNKKKKYKAFFEGETFMAARNHFCDPIPYEDAMAQQQEIIVKFGLNKTKTSTMPEDVQSITEMGQESDNDDTAGPSRTSKRIRIAKDRDYEPPEYSPVVGNSSSLPDYSYLNSLEKRLVQPEDYQFGVGHKNQPNGRIIVFEENNPNLVREYSRDHGSTWYCRSCLRGSKKLYAYLKDGSFWVPPSHKCKPKQYADVMKEQQEIRDRYTVARHPLSVHSPGISLSMVAPVKPGMSSTLSSPDSLSFGTRTPRQRSVNNLYASQMQTPPTSLPIAPVEVPVTPISENEVRRQRQRTGQLQTNQQPSKSTFIPVFSSAAQPPTVSTGSPKYREVDSSTYVYGFNEHGDPQKRLIVYEEDRRYVREYVKSSIDDRWKCVNCKYGVARKDDDKFVITIKHECQPISLRRSRELQAQYRALADQKTRNGDDQEPISMHVSRIVPDRSETASRSSIDTNEMHYLREKRPISSSTPSIVASLREVDDDEWEFGFDSVGAKEKRIIVFEPDNHDYVREYRNDGADTRCLGCVLQRRVHARWVGDKLYVPYADGHVCNPRLYEEIQRQQRKNESKIGKRGKSPDRNLRSKRAKIAADDTDTSNSPVASDYADNNIMDSTQNSSVRHVPARPQVVNVQPQAVVSTAVLRDYVPPNYSTTVNYYNPSAFFLAECCKKLGLKYTPVAYKFFSNIDIQKVSPSSRPLRSLPTTENLYQGFSCFSYYLTGNEANTILIREMINRYVYNNFKSLGNCMGHDFSQFTHETPLIRDTLWSFTITGIHLECISRWFDCRIGIYADKKWKRYGNWDEEDCDMLTFLLEFKDGKYNPIISLSTV